MHGSIRRNLGRRLISTTILSIHIPRTFAPSPINCAEGHISACLMSAISRLTAAASGMYLGRGWGPFDKGRHAPVSGSHIAAGVRIERTVRPLLFVAYSWMRIPTCKLPCSREFSVHNSISESAPIRFCTQPCEPAVGRRSMDTHRALV